MFRKIFPLILFLLISCTYSHAEEFSAGAAVESTDVYVGETFLFQIQVSGSENPEQPDVSHIKDFTVEFAGGSQNSSSSITIVNGKVTKNIRTGYIFNYRLTPAKSGRLIIPAVNITSDGQVVSTSPVTILAKKPVETDDFKLNLTLSKNVCYVGEPVILTVTWYIGKNVRDFNFNLPVVHDDRFTIANPEIDTQSGKKLYRIQLGDGEVIGEEGQGVFENKKYSTITFQKILIPNKSGIIAVEQSTVSCNALSGYSNQRSNNTFSDFFDDDFFSSSRRAVYKTVVVPSNSLALHVKELPLKGKPSNFNGHIGSYKIETSASPVKVNIGDPITLTITISGPEYLKHVELPSLKAQENIRNNFKIPDERASAEINSNSKIFTQTIRPLNSSVREIPPVELPYFDTKTGKYLIAKSAPITLSVDETKVLTLLDAEGLADTRIAGNDIETMEKGIAFNYEDMTVLEKQHLTPLVSFREGAWPVLTITPPLLFILAFTGVTFHRKRSSDPLKVLARKAYSNLNKALKDTESASPEKVCSLVIDSYREYLGIKLKMPSGGAITFSDVKHKLESSGIEQNTIEKLKVLFESCEAGRYAGSITFKDNASLISEGLIIAEDLEKRLK